MLVNLLLRTRTIPLYSTWEALEVVPQASSTDTHLPRRVTHSCMVIAGGSAHHSSIHTHYQCHIGHTQGNTHCVKWVQRSGVRKG